MGRCIADYVRRSVDFKMADTRKVSPFVQNKRRLDRIVMRSSVFVADMTCIALRSKIKSRTYGSSLICIFCSILDREDVLVCSVQ